MRRRLVLLASLLVAISCGKGPTPPAPTPAAPTLACPASITETSTTNLPIPVVFTVPQAAGGVQPVSVTCTAQPGANFPIGSTTVTCTASDSLSRTAACSFAVTVRATPRLSKLSFVAFGDSITNGVKSDPVVATLFRAPMGLHGLGESLSYPYKLNGLLTGRYTAQQLTINNEGWPGEVASTTFTPDDGRVPGEVRLRSVLQQYRPEVVLLMEGTNDLFFGQDGNPATVNGVIVAALDRMITDARASGSEVLLATIPPQRLGSSRDKVARLIPGTNAAITSLATSRNVRLVDIYSALNANVNLYIGADNLHPTEAGFAKIAETFYDAIRSAYDSTPTTAARR